MLSPALSFGNLAPPEIGLVCAAVLLLLGAPGLSATQSPLPAIRASALRGYVRAFGAGAATGIGLAALAVPDRFLSLVLVAVGTAAVVVTLVETRERGVAPRRIGWDLGMTAVFFLAWSLTTAVVAWYWPPV